MMCVMRVGSRSANMRGVPGEWGARAFSNECWPRRAILQQTLALFAATLTSGGKHWKRRADILNSQACKFGGLTRMTGSGRYRKVSPKFRRSAAESM